MTDDLTALVQRMRDHSALLNRYADACSDPCGEAAHVHRLAATECRAWADELAAILAEPRTVPGDDAPVELRELRHERDEARARWDYWHAEALALIKERDGLAAQLRAAVLAQPPQPVKLTEVLQENEALRDWRASVTAALGRPGGSFYADVPDHIRYWRRTVSAIVDENVEQDDEQISCRVCEDDAELHAPECPILKLTLLLGTAPVEQAAVLAGGVPRPQMQEQENDTRVDTPDG